MHLLSKKKSSINLEFSNTRYVGLIEGKPQEANRLVGQPEQERSIMAQEYDYQYLAPSADETLERLIAMTNQTNLVALDKTLAAIRRSSGSYAAAAARTGSIGERIVRAVHEVGMTLPAHQRIV